MALCSRLLRIIGAEAVVALRALAEGLDPSLFIFLKSREERIYERDKP